MIKQNITTTDLNQLSESGKQKYLEYVHRDTQYLMNIGEMIEFLNRHKIGKFEMGIKSVWFVDIDITPGVGTVINNKELCDALWSAVVEVLNK